MKKSYFTSESVTSGHPDKVCDQIADRILDELLRQDPESHVACEVTCATDQVHIFGEISSDANVDYEDIARKTIAGIGYTERGHGFDADSCVVKVDLHEQSSDIARGILKKGGNGPAMPQRRAVRRQRIFFSGTSVPESLRRRTEQSIGTCRKVQQF